MLGSVWRRGVDEELLLNPSNPVMVYTETGRLLMWSPNPIVESCGKQGSELESHKQVVMLEVEEVLILLLEFGRLMI